MLLGLVFARGDKLLAKVMNSLTEDVACQKACVKSMRDSDTVKRAVGPVALDKTMDGATCGLAVHWLMGLWCRCGRNGQLRRKGQWMKRWWWKLTVQTACVCDQGWEDMVGW